MISKIVGFISFCFICFFAEAQYKVSGLVLNGNKHPVAYAVVSIPIIGLVTTSDDRGFFMLKNVPRGLTGFRISASGFVSLDSDVFISGDTSNVQFSIVMADLTLKDVVVTAKKSRDLTTSYLLDRTVLDHMQILNATDVASLLPGGKTSTTSNLATSGNQLFYINGQSGEMGNPDFGVGVEIDGVRLSNNAIYGISGSDTRNIASSNIQSVEIITGIPSVEYGDASNGIVKINTRKGRSPFIIEALTEPNTKQLSLSKGLALGPKSGVLNFSLEYTKSVSSLTSPYTSYSRHALSLNYSNTLNRKKGHPVILNLGVAGNLGGYDSKSDPDMYVNTYTKLRDNVLRGNVSVKWIVNSPWLTTLEGKATINYNDRLETSSTNKSSSSSVAAIHTTENGYHVGQTYAENPDAAVLLISPGYWYELSYDDSKLLNYSGTLKATLYKKIGRSLFNLLAGLEYTNSGNNGKGVYYADPQYTPTWRAYPYNTIPHDRNYALYLEDRLTIPFAKSKFQLMAGLRSDNTMIKGGSYGTVSALSPRLNANYIFFEKQQQTIQDLSVKIGWGKMVKLPSFSILFPKPNYVDWLTFAPGTTSTGETYYAYYTMPTKSLYNPDLKWQYTIQNEISLNTNIDGNNIAITFSREKTENTYESSAVITPFTYKFTDQSSLENISIPASNRSYSVDQTTGVVTVSDKTGALPSVVLPYTSLTRGVYNYKYINGSPILRKKLSWIVDFKQLDPLKTAIRVDGNYYYYKGIDYTLSAYLPSSTVMSDGSIYKYIGFYTGGASVANGSITKTMNMNITAITHIPAIRLIVSARFEGTFLDVSRNLSQYADGSQRGFVLDDKGDYTASTTLKDIYGGNRYVAVYPEYYASLDDMNTLVPFKDKFLWAKDNDINLYNDLSKLVEKSNYNYYFNKNSLSFIYSVNMAVTKEIGNVASITFRAVNFINNIGTYSSSWTQAKTSLFGSSLIPSFYYGLSLQLKL